MKIKRLGLYFSIAVALAFTTKNSATKSTSFLIDPDSSLVLKGTSNVNSFSCLYNISAFKSPIPVLYHLEGDKMKFKNTLLTLNNSCFDCGGRGINNDFHKILKSENYPEIALSLQEISLNDHKSDARASISVEITGVVNNYNIPLQIVKGDEIRVTGDLCISLDDYNLKAPKKLFGLISINDTIEISFQLLLRSLREDLPKQAQAKFKA